jgi:hypothetical protein
MQMFKNESSVMEFIVAIVVSLYLLGDVDCRRFDGEYTKEKYCPGKWNCNVKLKIASSTCTFNN